MSSIFFLQKQFESNHSQGIRNYFILLPEGHSGYLTSSQALHAAGDPELGGGFSATFTGIALMAAAGLVGIAVGVPLVLMAAPLLAAGGLALYLESLQLRDYAVFMFGASLTAAWFIIHHFWFLDVMLQVRNVKSIYLLSHSSLSSIQNLSL